jgi:glucose/arabinose dehydrogenase
VLAPEYGGDGRKVGRCAAAKDPIIAFPGHWAPMSLAFYSGNKFGSPYNGGLFVAFHGSWNRAPLPQAGFRVVFAPFTDGKATGSYATFATGSTPTDLRATGLGVGPDGSLYLSADQNGRIWKIVRK